MSKNHSARVLIVDDQPVVGDAMRRLIDDQQDMSVVGMATSVAESISRVEELQPDIVLMDFRLPDGNGADAGSTIHQRDPQAKLVFMSCDDIYSTRLAAFNVGARAFIPKSKAATKLIDTLRVVAHGKSLMDPPSLLTAADVPRKDRRTEQRRTGLDRRQAK